MELPGKSGDRILLQPVPVWQERGETAVAGMETMVELRGVAKSYGSTAALKHLNLKVWPGEFLTLLGPSGCGKTTTLRLVAGFEEPSAGQIRIAGKPVQDLPPHLRPVNTVFQHYALFPHMTVAENIAFGLSMRRTPPAEVGRRVERALALVKLENLGNRRPRELSGGQQQRVAVARALVLEPKVLLLDEPLGALDLQLRRHMQVELKQLQRELGITFIYVTHDQEEALAMSDRIAVMNQGSLEQLDIPEAIYIRPASRFVAQFLGEANLLEGEADGSTLLRWEGHALRVADPLPRGQATVALRPERIRLLHPACSDSAVPDREENRLPGRVVEKLFVGTGTRLVVETPGGQKLAALVPPGPVPAPGEPVLLAFAPVHCVVVTS
jgi:spermidine/putrescine transport system ATP-binding protein